ncbi:MAG TPA: aminotransferase class V-fold PLP-dependent enzyme [Ignavibacteriaceae bacterium]|nr:aminotransferase class V-fold PLP-dependent enzyme [Ignavibacteriaceae bacterium]
MDLSKARSYFPHIKEGIIYFNHAATSPLSTLVTEKISEYTSERSYKWIDNFPRVGQFAKSTKEDLGQMLNCSPDRIAYTDNTTTGINILARGLKLERGDRILLNDIEFPANVYPFLNLQKEGIEIDFIKSHDGVVSSEDIIQNIKAKTKVVSISFVQFLTGYKADLEKIGNYCHKNNIIFCVDAIQGLGAFRLDVQKCKIDFLSAGTQKWLMGLQGLAFVYLTEELQNKIDMKYVGWLSVENAWDILDYNLKPLESADRYQNGTITHIGVYALRGALDLFLEFGWEEIEKQVLGNSIYLSEQLNKAGIKTLLSDCSKEFYSGIVSFKHDKSQKLYENLAENKINCAVREGMVRLSPHFYNSKEECDKVAKVIKDFNN